MPAPSPTSTPAQAPATSPAQTPQPLTFGVTLPESGLAKSLGMGLHRGIDLGLKEVNLVRSEQSLLPLSYLFEDSLCLDTEAARAVDILLSGATIKFIIGPVCGSAVKAAVQARRGTASVMLLPFSMDPSAMSDAQDTFRLWGDATSIVWNLTRMIKEKLSLDTIGLVSTKGPYGRSLADTFTQSARSRNIKIFPEAATDVLGGELRTTLHTVMNHNPKAIFLAMRTVDGARVLDELNKMGAKGIKVIFGPGLSVPSSTQIVRDMDVYFPVGWSPWFGDDLSQSFVAAYKAEYGKKPTDELPVWGYCAVKVMADALTRAGSDNPALVAQALRETALDTPAGRITFDKLGRADLPLKLLRFSQGRWSFIE